MKKTLIPTLWGKNGGGSGFMANGGGSGSIVADGITKIDETEE